MTGRTTILAGLPPGARRGRGGGRARGGRRNAPLTAGLALFALILLATLGASLLAWNGPNQTFPALSLLPPSGFFPFGTDSVGRDVFARVLHGGRISLLVAFPAVALALALGLGLGVTPASAAGGWTRSSCARWMCSSPSPPSC